FAAERDAIDAALARGDAESQAMLASSQREKVERDLVLREATAATAPPRALRRVMAAVAAAIAVVVVAWTWRSEPPQRPTVFKLDQQLHLKGSEPFNEQKGDRSK